MAGSRPTASGIGGEDLRQARQQQAADGEPLNDEPRRVQLINESLYVNITAYARDTHKITDGDQIVVETHQDCIKLVSPGVENGESE